MECTKPKPLQCSAQCKAFAETLHKVFAETQHSALAETLQALAETLLWGCAGVALPGKGEGGVLGLRWVTFGSDISYFFHILFTFV